MRRFLLPALLLAAAPLAQAQTTFGLTAGLNVANLSFDGDDALDDILDKGPRLGFVGGVFADVALTPQLAFHPEVLYSQKGYKLSADDGQMSGSITARVDYLEVPLLLAYRIPVGQNGLAVGLEAGPTLAYKLSSGISCGGDIPDDACDDLEGDDDFGDNVRDFDFGIAGGVTVGAGPFGVGLRYTQGLTTIDETSGSNDGIDARNGVFSVMARYAFGRR